MTIHPHIHHSERQLFRGQHPAVHPKPYRVNWIAGGHRYQVVVSATWALDAVSKARTAARRQGVPGPPVGRWGASAPAAELPLGEVERLGGES